MEFERYDRTARGTREVDLPDVKVWASGKLAFNETALEQWFDGCGHVELHTHVEEPKIGLIPVHEPTNYSYTLIRRSDYNGRVVDVRAVLRTMDCVRPEESMTLEAEYVREKGMLVVDVSPLL